MKQIGQVLFWGLFLGLVLKFAVVEAFTVPTASMWPTITEGQVVWVNKLPGQTYSKQAVVAFERAGTYYVKRITAVPGDSLYVLQTATGQTAFGLKPTEKVVATVVLPRKGQSVALSAANYAFYAPLISDTEGGAVAKVADQIFINNQASLIYTFQQDYFFLEGDNPMASIDSRQFGAIARSAFLGKCLLY